jgi:L-alanine-DL-glutamate epimerase-like enolase superfamily enzyme
MRIVRVRVDTLGIPFREPIVSAAHRWELRRVAIVSLQTDSGLRGLGEFAAAEPDDLGEDVSARLVLALEGIDLGDPVTLEGVLHHIDTWPFVGRVARSAVESALVDLLARNRGRSVAASLTDDPAVDVAANGLVGIRSSDAAASDALELVAAGFGCLKLKGGNEAPGRVEERVAAVRAAVGPDVALRVDFNGALDSSTAADVLRALAAFDLDYVEQPIPPSAGAEALAHLREHNGVRIAADESVRDIRSTRALLDADAVDALVVKPARVGGLRQAGSIVELAAAADVPVTVSTLFETGVGIAAGLQLAAAVPGAQAHGLATAELLESDLLRHTLPVLGGRMRVPDGAGLGIQLDDAAIERYRIA